MSVCVLWSLIVVVCAGRVYLGAHFATDVIATLLLALVFVASSELFIGWLHRRGGTSRLACGAHQRSLHGDQHPR